MKGINKLQVSRKLATILLAGTMAFSLTACGGHVDMKMLTPSEVLEIQDVKDVTLIDELIAAGMLNYSGELDIIEAADQLERYLDIIDVLKDMDFKQVSDLDKLSDEEYQEVFSLPIEEIEKLKEEANYKGKDLVLTERKLKALKQLNYLYNYCTIWAHENGQDISFEFMMAAVKGSVADELELGVEDYKTIKLPPAARSASSEPDYFIVCVGDKNYKVPVGAGELWNTINYIYEVQTAKLTEETEYPTYRKALNYAKTTMAAGANAKKDKLTEQYNASYIKENYTK